MSDFRTLEGYERLYKSPLTKTMEDYLEMICRMTGKNSFVRIQQIADALNVKPPSVSKIAKQLASEGYIDYRPYEYITLTAKGVAQGEYLLYRHDVLHEFLCALNHTENELEQVEMIEHFINEQTVKNIEELTKNLIKKPI